MKVMFQSLVLLMTAWAVPSLAAAKSLDLTVNAQAAILMNADTGAVLYEKNARALHYPASITKIATASYVLHTRGDKLDLLITADADAIGVVAEEVKRRSNYAMPSHVLVHGGTHMGIKKGEILSLKDLLYGLMLVSANDAANLIAQEVGGTIPQFIQELNEYLRQIGCSSTTFQNPHGLYHPKHQTTAYDMAIMSREALKNPKFREIVSTVKYTRPKTNKQEATTLVQGNRLLRSGKFYYPKAIGVKTGHLAIAGNTLVAAAKEGNRTLIAVLLKVEERKDMFLDAVKMFEAAFSQPKIQRVLLRSGPQKFTLQLPGAAAVVGTYINDDIILDYYPAEEPKVKCLLSWDSNLSFPIVKNQRVGELSFQFDNGEVWRTMPLYAQETIQATWWHSAKGIFTGGAKGRPFYIKILGIIAIVLVIGFFVWRLRGKM